jgi:protein subunit release factor A
VGLLLACREPKQLGDAVLSVTRVGGQGQSLAAVERIATMYLKFARRRHFNVEVLDDHLWQSPPEDSISLLIGGVGAHLLLATEQGLHALSRGVGRMDVGQHPEREIVRVDVGLVDSAAQALARSDLRVTVRPLAHVAGRLIRRPRLDVQLLHPASMVSMRAWTDCDEASAVERLMPLVQARINMVAQGSESSYGKESLVRRYRLGPSQLVRDARTGRKSGRLGLVFDGHLDAFLVALSPSEAERP